MTELSRGAGRPAPALRSILALHLAALLAGIALGDAGPVLPRPALGAAFTAIVLAGILRRRPAPAAALLLLGTLSAGVALPARWTAPPPPADLTRVLCDAPPCDAPVRTVLTGTIAAPPRPTSGGTRITLAVEEIARGGRRTRATGLVRVHVRTEAEGFAAGDRILLAATLHVPRRYRNPGCADLPRVLAREGIRFVAAVDSGRAIVVLRSGAESGRRLESIRASLSAFVRREAPDQAGVLEALLLGEQGRIPRATRDAYARAGVAHVLSVSGLHVSLVALLVAGTLGSILRRVPAVAAAGHGKRWALAGGVAAAWGYALLAGGEAPGLRAATMAGALAAAAIARRRGDAWNALLLAAGWIALAEPARVFQVGVQLSFVSAAWLVLSWPAISPSNAPPAVAADRPLPTRAALVALRWIRTSVAITCGVTLATASIQANAFGRISLVAPIANLVVVPLSGSIAVPLLLAAGVTLPAEEPLAALLLHGAAIAVRLSTAFAVWLARLPWAALPVPRLTIPESVACMALAFALPGWCRSAGGALAPRARIAALGAALFLAADAAVVWLGARPPESLRVTFLDVGQGDAALVETPEGDRILVDAGPAFSFPGGARFDAGEAAVAPALGSWRIRRLAVLAVSHPDADHAGGAAAILDRFKVGELWYPAGSERIALMEGILRVARARGVRVRGLGLGDAPRVRGRTRIEILGPPPDATRSDAVRARARWNDASLVLRVVAPGLSVLLPGDVEAAGEGAILRSGRNPQADVLKVAHHGSATSSTSAFLSAVAPRIAILSVGAWNRFGFPDPRLPDRLRRQGIRVFRTDRDGAVTVTLEEGRVRVRRADEGGPECPFNFLRHLVEKRRGPNRGKQAGGRALTRVDAARHRGTGTVEPILVCLCVWPRGKGESTT